MLYQKVQLTAGIEFELAFALRSTGPVQVRAYDESTAAFIGEAVTLTAQPMAQHYRIRVKIPGPAGTPVAIRAPVFVIDDAGSEIVLHSVTLNEVGA